MKTQSRCLPLLSHLKTVQVLMLLLLLICFSKENYLRAKSTFFTLIPCIESLSPLVYGINIELQNHRIVWVVKDL